jgi:hypothetical protein
LRSSGKRPTVDVRVRQDHRVEGVQIEIETGGVALVLIATRLDHAAVEQDASTRGLDQVTGTGDFARSAEKRQLHAVLLALWRQWVEPCPRRSVA